MGEASLHTLPSPLFFTAAPDVTRFGQEIGSIMMVAGVIVVIADLQQKTAGPKIELLQTVKKRGGVERKEVIRSSAEVEWMAWRPWPTKATTKKVSFEAEIFEWGVTQAEHIDTTR